MAFASAPTNPQVDITAQFPTFVYIVGLICIMAALGGVFLFDIGLSRRGNVVHTFVQKMVAAFVAAAGMSIAGFAIWDWQFTKAFGSPHPLADALSDWWLGGPNINTFAQNLDPAAVPGADGFQAFYAVFILFAAFFAGLLAGSVIERVRTLPLSIITLVFGALVIPYAGYLVYGSVGPLSNSGTHDFGGAFFYILLGCWALVLVWRAKPRPGAVPGSRGSEPPVPHNLAYTMAGLVLFLVGICGYVLLNGYLIPGSGYFGITLNDSGMGIIVTNLMMAFTFSVLGGVVAWKVGGHPYFLLVSPVAGWIGTSAFIDVAKPWQVGAAALVAPLVVVVGYRLMNRLRLDDVKVVPLTLLPGIYSAVLAGVVGSGVKQGGYFGLEGDYAPQHATIGLGHQLVGVLVFLALGLGTALIVVLAVQLTMGLRDKRIDEGDDCRLDATVVGDGAYGDVSQHHDAAQPAAETGVPAGVD